MSRALPRSTCVLLLAAGCGRIDFGSLAGGPGSDAGGPGPDAGGPGPDAGRDTAASLDCGHAGELFCDGFESGDLSAWSGGNQGMLTVQTAHVHHGTFGLQVTTTDTVKSAAIGTPLPGVLTGSIHGRAWFFVPSGFTFAKVDVLSMENASGGVGVVFVVDQDKLVAYDELVSTNATITTNEFIPHDQWFCVELHVVISTDGMDGSVTIDLGTQKKIGMGGQLNTMPASTGYKYLNVGMDPVATGQQAGSFFVDDVVVGTQPIGCD